MKKERTLSDILPSDPDQYLHIAPSCGTLVLERYSFDARRMEEKQ